jgi:hypothetical protein
VSTRTKTASSGLARTDLSEARAKELYRRLWTSRLIDERGRKLFRQGRMLGNMYTAVGQEAITLVPAFCLNEQDFIGPSHRELPASVGKGVPLKAIFAQILARAVSPDRGKSHPCHYGYAPLRVLTPASTVAAQYVVATGVALAYRLQKNGNVAIAYTGDGGTARPPYGIGTFEMGSNLFIQHSATNPFEVMRGIAALVGGGVLDIFPTLRAAFLEAGVGWLPFWMERLDEHYELMPEYVPFLKRKPSEVIRSENFFISCDPDEETLPFVVSTGNNSSNVLSVHLLKFAILRAGPVSSRICMPVPARSTM